MKIWKSKSLFLYLLSLSFCFTAVSAVQEPTELFGNRKSVNGGNYNDTKLPLESLEYVPNEIIVKFRENAAEVLEMKMAEGAPASELKISDSLDRLHKKYRLRKTKALFKNFKKKRQRVKALLRKNRSLLTRKEKRILRRLKRIPKGVKVPDLSRIYEIKLDLEPGQSLQKALREYKSNPNVEYAELNYIVSVNLAPNDPLYSIQWPVNNTGQMYPESGKYNEPPGTLDCDMDAPEAWEIHTGSPEVIVAVVDTGVDYMHRDLQNNTWVNQAELNGSAGVDDDENGYIDDIYGYDFCAMGDKERDSDPIDDHGHGTHCAGIIAAEGNNGFDIAGVCWEAKIMALKFLNSGGSGSSADAVTAFYYAVDNGADVVSNSWGGGGYSQSMQDAIDYAYSQGVIMVAAAGNDYSDEPQYPANYEHTIAVAATNSNDEKAAFSNYGDWVDIAAPGVDILSLRADGTSMGTTYDDYTTIASGTSMACPYVAGACALLLSANPTLVYDEMYNVLTNTVDTVSPGICLSDGRVNVNSAMYMAVPSRGYVRLDRDYYTCSAVVSILLSDSDLEGTGSHTVIVTTSGGDSERVILTETPELGIFTGTISTDSGDLNIGDGMLQVSHNQTITATYEDADNGSGNPATANDIAVADCQYPGLFNVLVESRGIVARITFETDELTTGHVRYGLACDELYTTVNNDIGLSTNHTIYMTELPTDTTFYLIIDANDIAGNQTTDDNGGICYSFTTNSAPTILRVPSEFPTIQAAIDDAWHWGWDTVLVADGIYTGMGNRDIDFGGKTIIVISENGPYSCIIDCQGTEADPHRGFTFRNSENADSVLDGFTVTNGYGPEEPLEYGVGQSVGGAILCNGASPTIKNCIIQNCSAGMYGGGIFCTGTQTTITNCIIRNNRAIEYRGGGISGCYGVISECVITGNWAQDGGGISGDEDDVNTKVGNKLATPNYLSENGNCIVNCIISDNTAVTYGGGLNHYNGNIINCTIVNNTAGRTGGGLYGCDGEISSCIIWNNGQEALYECEQPSYSCFPSNDGTNGNITLEPTFAFDDDYHLMPNSPCIDTGTNDPPCGLPTTDIDGNPRPVDGNADGNDIADMGAYEYNNQQPCIAVSPSLVEFFIFENENPEEQLLLIRNSGTGTLAWQINEDCPWLEVNLTAGESAGDINEVVLTVDISGLSADNYTCLLTVFDDEAINSPRTVEVNLRVNKNLHVPLESPTIQAALNVAEEGDKVTVAPGTYYENISFNGTNITLTSTNPKAWANVESTVIHGGGSGTVVTFSGGRNENCLLTGFTITGGNAPLDGGFRHGGGVYGYWTASTIERCILKDNHAEDDGGGIYLFSGIINSCIITGNSAGRNGGALAYSPDASVINCIISGNSAGGEGGGMRSCNSIINCTIVDNMAETGGELSNCKGQISNCIIWDNTPDVLYDCAQPSYSCFSGAEYGTGNIDIDPEFVNAANGNYHLQPGSFCIDAGTNSPIGGLPTTDIDRQTRPVDGDNDGQAIADMGAYESLPSDALLIDLPVWEFQFIAREGGSNPEEQVLIVRNNGGGTINWTITETCDWLEVDPYQGSSSGQTNEVALYVDTTGLSKGNYNCELMVSAPGALNSPKTVQVNLVIWNTLYVRSQYSTIQAAIDAASDWDKIIVSPGQYYESINFNGKNITLKSTDPDDPATVESTIIRMGGATGSTVTFSGSEKEHCILSGFTITGGNVSYGGGIIGNGTTATITKCIISNNRTTGHGGGIHGCNGIISQCIITKNSANYGGGLYDCDNGSIVNCIISDNIAITASPLQPGVGGGLMNCDSDIINCTIVNNTADYQGAGLSHCLGEISNCIIWYNDSPIEPFHNCPQVTYNCIQDWTRDWWMLGDMGNITDDPLFANHIEGDYHLLPSSPCIDTGTNDPIGGLPATDFEGYLRPMDGDSDGNSVADMGAYEKLDPCLPIFEVTPHTIEFFAFEGGANPDAQILSVSNIGSGTLAWQITGEALWLDVNSATGESTGEIDEVILNADISNLLAGEYTCDLVVFCDQAVNNLITIQMILHVSAELHVPGYYPTIQAAIDAAQENNTIIVAQGIYNENITIGKNIILTSVNPDSPDVVVATVIQGDGTTSVVRFANNVGPSCILSGFTITGGNAPGGGGGIYGNYDLATITKCVITGNYAGNSGGGGVYKSNGIINQCVIVGNFVSDKGGGLGNCPNATIINCIISNNTATSRGGGLYNCNGKIANCTIAGNSASSNGGGLRYCRSAEISNCIIWNNSPGALYDCSQPSYSCYPGSSGDGNIDADPLFVDSANDDYHLLPDSPCIDAGYPALDWSSEPWPNGGRINIGAYGNTIEATRSRADLQFAGFNIISKTRVDRTIFRYVLSLSLTNISDTDISDVHVQLIDASEQVTTVIDDKIFFPLIGANSTTDSNDFSDYFIIEVDRLELVIPGRLAWEADYTRTGDFTDDGKVDFEDLCKLAQQWLWTGQAGNIPEDIVKDGYVNFLDFAKFAENWME